MQNFIKEVSNYLENSITNNKRISNNDCSFIDIYSDDLTLDGEKVIARYRDKMLTERAQLLQKYSENTKGKGEVYYIYSVNSYDLNNKADGEIEEIEFPKDLYETAKKGDKLIYQDGEYQRYDYIENEIKK